jgi:hypothetical protein
MFVMCLVWQFVRRPRPSPPNPGSVPQDSTTPLLPSSPSVTDAEGSGDAYQRLSPQRRWWFSDLVDVTTVDLYADECGDAVEDDDTKGDRDVRERRLRDKAGYLWQVYYWLV